MSNRKILERALEHFSRPNERHLYFDLYAEDVIFHGYEGVQPGLESVRRYYEAFWTAFPDARINREDLLEQVDKIVLRYTVVATHTGPFLGRDPSGRSVHLPGIAILRFADHRCIERWTETNSLSLLRQIGFA